MTEMTRIVLGGVKDLQARFTATGSTRMCDPGILGRDKRKTVEEHTGISVAGFDEPLAVPGTDATSTRS